VEAKTGISAAECSCLLKSERKGKKTDLCKGRALIPIIMGGQGENKITKSYRLSPRGREVSGFLCL